MDVDEALEVARDLENHDRTDHSKAAAVLGYEVRRLREIEQRALEVNGDPTSSNEAAGVARYILGEVS